MLDQRPPVVLCRLSFFMIQCMTADRRQRTSSLQEAALISVMVMPLDINYGNTAW